ncbi:MAG: pyrroline-5-carboxylate reductase [Oscillospiraceae bacterium]|nr:pyrroline-5-carboxylate reductase [Oscillospiraceae bacterium]
MENSIGFIGAGNMAGAIIGGILRAKICLPEQVWASAPSMKHLSALQEKYQIHVTTDNREAAAQADILVLAVKPYLIESVIEQIKGQIRPGAIVVSIAAGVTLAQMDEGFDAPVHLVRVMPNTPCMVGEGMSAIFPGRWITPEETEEIRAIFSALGRAEVLEERLIDVVGAVSGSSPAYVYLFVEAMADAAVKGGMPRAQAYRFAAQAVLGSAKMVLETGLHPGVLKDMVCSPGGTTIEAIEVLEQKGMRGAVFAAMDACIEKSVRMSGKQENAGTLLSSK